ncbi:MAG: thioredoxin [Clostridia bacterium]|nr:thioredoxin [Oscillospiraceae bacterium]MBP3600629.1 thioredoxin [Clostridia bacterium]
MSILNVTKENFEKDIIESQKTVLLDFYADWCGPCKMLSPIVEEIAEENPQYLVGKINVDNEPELAAAFSVQSIPLLVVMKNGKIAGQVVGYRPKEQILSLLAE